VPGFYVDTRSWVTTAVVLGLLLLPHLASRFIVAWLYNGAGASVLIAGLFHSMHNALVNPTGLVAVIGLPQGEILVIVAGLAVLAGGIIAVDTRGRLGLKRASPPDTDRVSEGLRADAQELDIRGSAPTSERSPSDHPPTGAAATSWDRKRPRYSLSPSMLAGCSL
jgi:hypothetical protein